MCKTRHKTIRYWHRKIISGCTTHPNQKTKKLALKTAQNHLSILFDFKQSPLLHHNPTRKGLACTAQFNHIYPLGQSLQRNTELLARPV